MPAQIFMMVHFKNFLGMYHIISVLLTVLFLSVPVISDTGSCLSPTLPTTACDCFVKDSKKIINCRYKNLTQIPTFTDTHVVYDEIKFTSTELTGQCHEDSGCNDIKQIGSGSFTNLKVKKIDLRNNPVTSIDDNAFITLTQVLEGLLIEGNGSSFLPYQALAPLEKLTTLHLEGYGNTRFASPIVLPFPNLFSLTLKKCNNLNYLDQGVFSIMQNLSEFNLHNLPALVSLPVPAIQMFHLNLKTIDIMDTGITSILAEIFAPLSVLNEVKIHSNNHLNSLAQRTFHGVTDTVKTLDLDNNILNNIEFLRNENWTALSHLNIGYNFDLRTLPSGIFSTASTLDYLICQDIGLEGIDESIFSGLSNLHTLDLAYNKIKTVGTGAFQHSSNLVELRLFDQNTNGESIVFHSNAYNGIETSVEIISLDNNKFDLPQFWDELTGLTNLKVLELVNTGIANIPDKAFRSNTQLNTLLISNNNIMSLQQATFYGPRNTLQTIDLHGNKIQNVDECTLSDFSTKPTMKLANNPLNCNCSLAWLYDWWMTQGDQTAAYDIATCATPSSLATKSFDQFTRDEMCPGGTSVRTCPDLYATTTTTSTTTTTLTTTTQAPTTAPLPTFVLIIFHTDTTSIQVTWTVNDESDLTGLKLELLSNSAPTKVNYLGKKQNSYTFHELTPDTTYTFCLILQINEVDRDTDPECKSGTTLPQYTVDPSKSSSTIAPTSDSQLGVIVGASVGGVVLIALIIAILVILLRSNKPKKPPAEPLHFTLHADIPQAGGTAKRFGKKMEKEDAAPDDITVTVISNGDMTNKDRISAGSYQALNEKGVDIRPMPSSSRGHYTNSVEDRPLPRAPHGLKGANGHGYVNNGNKNSGEHLPETSQNEYMEVRY